MQIIRKLSMALLISAVATGAAYAEEDKYKADLEPSSEVPPTTSKGHGMVQATLDPSTKLFKWNISFEGLTGPAIAAHFHGPAGVGKNAPPVIPVDVPKARSGSVSGAQTLTDDQLTDLTTGNWYFNVHTAMNKTGEIRGQLRPTH